LLKIDSLDIIIEIHGSNYIATGTAKLKYSAKSLDEILEFIKNTVSIIGASGVSSIESSSVL